METTKTCRTCQKTKSTSEFGRVTSSKDGLNAVCKDCRIKEGKTYRESNKEAISRRWKLRYRLDPSKKKEQSKRYLDSGGRVNRRKRAKQRYKTDPVYRLTVLITSKLRDILAGRREYVGKSMIPPIVGLTGPELVNYLWSTFELNYGIPRSWVKRSDVEIDHIIPKHTANTIEDVKKLNHYTNLQLLFKEDNVSKRSKMPDELKGDNNE